MKISNPYLIDKPVDDPALLLGRSEVYRWIDSNLGLGNQNRAMVISSQPGVGKTSVLRNLSLLLERPNQIIFNIDARSIHKVSSSESTWSLVKLFDRALSSRSIPPPLVEKSDFVLQPERKFIQDYWEPVLKSNYINSVVLVIDNMELLSSEMKTGTDLKRKRQFLWSLLRRYDGIDMVISLQGRPEMYSPGTVAPFSIAAHYQLQFLTPDETFQLLNISDQFTIPGYVGDFIFKLTSGHPADVQRLGFHLFERSTKIGCRIITLADVLAVLSAELKGGDFYQPIYKKREKTKVIYSRVTDAFEFVDDFHQS